MPKFELGEKMFGVFEHRVLQRHAHIVRGVDEVFPAPHSRHTGVARDAILAADGLELIAESEVAGVYLATSRDPVSYTHLDVYKRQLQPRPAHGGA